MITIWQEPLSAPTRATLAKHGVARVKSFFMDCRKANRHTYHCLLRESGVPNDSQFARYSGSLTERLSYKPDSE